MQVEVRSYPRWGGRRDRAGRARAVGAMRSGAAVRLIYVGGVRPRDTGTGVGGGRASCLGPGAGKRTASRGRPPGGGRGGGARGRGRWKRGEEKLAGSGIA